jgi:excisionase family DNA binding protein
MALFLTPRQVAERWGCSARHVRDLCQRGDLRAMRLGLESWRIAVSEVEAYERRQTTEPRSDEAPKQEAPKEGRPPVPIDGFTLPADYEPVFAELWPGHAPRTRKAAVQRH